MASSERLIAASDQIVERGKGYRFTVDTDDGDWLPAFAIRYGGVVFAYLNRCAHISVELDWAEGDFFDATGLYLICATHGATYSPESGQCVAGPCQGGRLVPLRTTEHDGKVYLIKREDDADGP
jgi:nitrite reductase/ring-hydroxylating ferredoxin subunit